jgi:hypothetical protein
MKRLRITRGMSVVRRRGVKLAAVAAGLVALGAFAVVPAVAKHDGRGNAPAAGEQRSDAGDHPSHAGGKVRNTGDPLVTFRRNAIFTCFGAFGGANTANTANITASLTTVKAVVTVHARAGTTVFGQLTQSGCLRLKFFTFTVPASGVGTTTVTDLRISANAFVWFNDTVGDFQITPEVVFF